VQRRTTTRGRSATGRLAQRYDQIPTLRMKQRREGSALPAAGRHPENQMRASRRCGRVRHSPAGRENALRKVGELSQQTSHEIRVMHVLSNTVIASTKGPRA